MRQIEDLDAKLASMRSREGELKNECLALQRDKDQVQRDLEHEMQARSLDKKHWKLQMNNLKNAHEDNIGKLKDSFEQEKTRLMEVNTQEREIWEQLKTRQENAIQQLKAQVEDLKVQNSAGTKQHKSQIETMEREFEEQKVVVLAIQDILWEWWFFIFFWLKAGYILQSESKIALLKKELADVQLKSKLLDQKLALKQEQISDLEEKIVTKSAQITQLETVRKTD